MEKLDSAQKCSILRPLNSKLGSVGPSLGWVSLCLEESLSGGRGWSLSGGLCPGGLCQGEPPCLDRQTPVKTYRLQTSFAGGKNTPFNFA